MIYAGATRNDVLALYPLLDLSTIRAWGMGWDQPQEFSERARVYAARDVWSSFKNPRGIPMAMLTHEISIAWDLRVRHFASYALRSGSCMLRRNCIERKDRVS